MHLLDIDGTENKCRQLLYDILHVLTLFVSCLIVDLMHICLHTDNIRL